MVKKEIFSFRCSMLLTIVYLFVLFFLFLFFFIVVFVLVELRYWIIPLVYLNFSLGMHQELRRLVPKLWVHAYTIRLE